MNDFLFYTSKTSGLKKAIRKNRVVEIEEGKEGRAYIEIQGYSELELTEETFDEIRQQLEVKATIDKNGITFGIE